MSALVTPLWPSGPITLAEWEALPPHDELRLECSEGVLVVNPSPRLGHQVATVRLAHLDNREITCHWGPQGESYRLSDVLHGSAVLLACGTEIRLDVNTLAGA